jgi:hypothetical protein
LLYHYGQPAFCRRDTRLSEAGYESDDDGGCRGDLGLLFRSSRGETAFKISFTQPLRGICLGRLRKIIASGAQFFQIPADPFVKNGCRKTALRLKQVRLKQSNRKGAVTRSQQSPNWLLSQLTAGRDVLVCFHARSPMSQPPTLVLSQPEYLVEGKWRRPRSMGASLTSNVGEPAT